MPLFPADRHAPPYGLLYNGDMQINTQALYVSSFTGGAVTAGNYGYDGWKADTGGATFSVSGVTITLTAGIIVQVVELALWGYASLASTQVTASVEDPSADMTATFGSSSGTIPAGSGRQSCTFTTAGGDTGNLSFKLQKATGSNVTFARAKLELGPVATAWRPRSLGEELAICQRYYERLRLAGYGYGLTGSAQGGECGFRTLKRATPTMARLQNDYIWVESNCGTGPATVSATQTEVHHYRTVTSDGQILYSEVWEADARL